MSQQYQEKKQQGNVAAQLSNANGMVLNSEELASLEPVELQSIQGNAFVVNGVSQQTYVVQNGDSLSDLSSRFLGDASLWPQLYNANQEIVGSDPNILQPGQVLVLPGRESGDASSALSGTQSVNPMSNHGPVSNPSSQELANSQSEAQRLNGSQTPTNQMPWASTLFTDGVESIENVDWASDNDSSYSLDGEVRTQHTRDAFAMADKKVLLEGELGRLDMENITDVEYYSGGSATLAREGVVSSGRSQTVDGVVTEENKRLSNRVEGTLNHDSSGISGNGGASVSYSDSLTVSDGQMTEERSRSLGGGTIVISDSGSHEINSTLEGGVSRATVTTNGDKMETFERGVHSDTNVIHTRDRDGDVETLVINDVSGNLSKSTQTTEGQDVITNQVFTKGTVGQDTHLSDGGRSTNVNVGLDVGGTRKIETQDGATSTTEHTGLKVSGNHEKSLTSSEKESRLAISGTRGTENTTVLDEQNQFTQTRGHEASVYFTNDSDAEEVFSNTIGLKYAYTSGDTAFEQDFSGNTSTEKSEWKAGGSVELDDDEQLQLEGRLSYETAIGNSQVDGKTRSDSVIDGVFVSTETGDDLSMEDAGISAELSRTFADKTEGTNELNESVVEKNMKKLSLSGTAKREEGEELQRALGVSASDMNIVDTTHSDGSTTRDKTINKANIDSRKSLSVSTEKEHVENFNQEQLTDNTRLTTMQGKTNLKGGASTVIDGEGKRKYVGDVSAAYTAYEQKVRHSMDSLAKKVEGLKLGDRDTEGEDRVRMLQRALKADGANIVEDGEFDAETKSAVEAFQTKHGIAVTGEVDALTAEAFPRLGLLHHGAMLNAGWHAGKAEASLKAEAQFNGDQIKVKGVAGAKVTMVGANARIDVPALQWRLGGETMQAVATVGVNASVLAEVNGIINLDIDKSDGLDIGVGPELKAFAGAKAGIEVGAELRWIRNSPSHYGEMLKDYAKILPGTWDDAMIEKVPEELWPQLATLLVGTRFSKVMYAKAGVEGSAGIGAEGEFTAGINDGMIEVGGKLNGTFGLGGGVKTSLGLHAVDGIRLIGVLGMKGMNWLSDSVPEAAAWLDEVFDEIQLAVDNYLESKKQQGGFGGFAASAVDLIGDDLLNLW